MFIFSFSISVRLDFFYLFICFEAYLPLPGFPAPSAPGESKRIVNTPTP